MNSLAVYPPTAPEVRTEAMSRMTKPIKPTAPMPSRLIFMDSQSSVLSGFCESFRVLAA